MYRRGVVWSYKEEKQYGLKQNNGPSIGNERNCMNYRMFTLTCKMWNNETVNQNVREREYSHLYSRPR